MRRQKEEKTRKDAHSGMDSRQETRANGHNGWDSRQEIGAMFPTLTV